MAKSYVSKAGKVRLGWGTEHGGVVSLGLWRVVWQSGGPWMVEMIFRISFLLWVIFLV